MNVEDFCKQASEPESFSRKSRLLIVPSSKDRLEIRNVTSQFPCYEQVFVSSFITDNNYLPAPNLLFFRLTERIAQSNSNARCAIVWGLNGMFALWNEENRKQAYACIQKALDDTNLRFWMVISEKDDALGKQFYHPRYKEGQSLMAIASSAEQNDARMQIHFVSRIFTSYAPGSPCQNIQQFLRGYESESFPTENINIAIDYSSAPLAGIRPEVDQILSMKGFFEAYLGLDVPLSDSALVWLFHQLEDNPNTASALSLAQNYFFPEGLHAAEAVSIPSKMQTLGKTEREILFWTLCQTVKDDCYLNRVLHNPTVSANSFVSCYVQEASNLSGSPNARQYSQERKEALQKISSGLDGEICALIERLKPYPTEEAAIWLNIGTKAEKTELIRRLMTTESATIPDSVYESYPLFKAYMEPYAFSDVKLNSYFTEYRLLKVKNRVTEDFCRKAANVEYPPDVSGLESRDNLLQAFACDSQTGLLVVDALGAEYLPAIIALLGSYGLESAEPCYAKIPTSTRFNPIDWPKDRFRKDVKEWDTVVHNGAEIHTVKENEENFVALLETIRRIESELTEALHQCNRVILTADHGASRLAVCAYNQNLAENIPIPVDEDIADWRFASATFGKEPPEGTVINVSGNYWVVKGYNRFSKKGGKNHELHGGLSLEEVLVPFAVFKRGSELKVPEPVVDTIQEEIVEKDDFADL